jgi:hypothetical protein
MLRHDIQNSRERERIVGDQVPASEGTFSIPDFH